MRAALCLSVAFAACCLVVVAAQAPQAPVFRSSVEVLEVDVSVVDDRSAPVPDVQAAEFTVTVDGKPRRVISSQYVSDVSPESQGAFAAADPYVSTNSDVRPGRLIALVIDQNNMTTDRLRGAQDAIKRFVGGLAPNDRVALMSIPAPGTSIDFTTNHRQVQDALTNMRGNDEVERDKYVISTYEALAVAEGRDKPTISRMLARLCEGTDPSPLGACGRDVAYDAVQIAQRIRIHTSESVEALAALLRILEGVDGSKSLVLLSQGLILDESQSDAGMLAELAAAARVNVNVLLFDGRGSSASARSISDTPSEDRGLRETGLTQWATRSRGTVFHVISGPESSFARITAELSGHYILGVDPLPSDRDGKPHNIRVQVRRSGTSLRARQQFRYLPRPTSDWAREDQMSRVLRSPSPATQIPIRMTTYAYQGAAPTPQKSQVVIAAELDPPTSGVVDLAVGYALYDEAGRALDVGQERKIYSANSDRPLHYEARILVNPGTYRLRVAAIDLSGNSGSVDREVHAAQTNIQEVAVGDLMLATVRDIQGGFVRPPVLLKVEDGNVQAYTEIYTNKAGSLAQSRVAFEVAEAPDGPAIRSDTQSFQTKPDGMSAAAAANLSVTALPPGKYFVRAMITSADRTVGKLVRPFELRAGTGVATGLFSGRQEGFTRDDVLKPETLRATFDVLEKTHPLAKAAVAKGRSGQLEGTAVLALDAGDQAAGAMLRGLELLMKGQLDPAATQFGVALRSRPDSPLASFYLGVCFAAAGKDREALSNWERAKSEQLAIPALSTVIGQAHMRLGEQAQAAGPLSEALSAQPQNDSVRKSLAIVQSNLGRHDQAYDTIQSYLEKHMNDTDALMVALHALYQVHAAGKSLGTAEEDLSKAMTYAKAYAAAKGPNQPLVEKWVQFLSAPK
ncbi:MAG TPA: VWA domain-containing protein [Vicinamibacterales bacterium]|nr:VWA domain-containing protein [Vicinamibacterales bacterium]